MDKKFKSKKTNDGVKIPDFREKDLDFELLHKDERIDLDSFWDGETIRDDNEI